VTSLHHFFLILTVRSLSDHELVWKYVDWVLEKDEEMGVRVLTERPANEPPSERLRADAVIDYLHRFPRAVIAYLEHLVFTRKMEVTVCFILLFYADVVVIGVIIVIVVVVIVFIVIVIVFIVFIIVIIIFIVVVLIIIIILINIIIIIIIIIHLSSSSSSSPSPPSS
jgi:hypothetical protein